MDNYLKVYNDYEVVKDNHLDGKLYHYTKSIEAVKGIVADGNFFATDMKDFEDGNEGRKALKDLREWLINKISMDSHRRAILDYVSTDEKINNFFDNHKTFVVSLCKNSNSKYMWNKYADKGFMIEFDKRKLLSSLVVHTGNEDIRDDIFKYNEVYYSETKQLDVNQQQSNKLLPVLPKKLMDIMASKIMYIGNFFKCKDDYEREEEYRVLINCCNYNNTSIVPLLPKYEKNGAKHFTRFYFDKSAIEGIVCFDSAAKKQVDDLGLKIPVEIRNGFV